MFGGTGESIGTLLSFGRGQKTPAQEAEPVPNEPVPKKPRILRVHLMDGDVIDITEDDEANLSYRVESCGALTIFQTKRYPYGVLDLCTGY